MRRLVAGVVIVLVGGACSGSGADTTTSSTATTVASTTTTAVAGDVVVEAPGASLVVAADSLPDGVASGDITITAGADPVTGPAVDALVESGFEPGPGFVLGPSGTTFTEPLVLRLEPSADGRMVAAFLVVDGGLEPLEPADDEGLAFLVPHFSTVTTFFGPWSATLSGPGAAVVGEPFTVRSQVVQVVGAATSEGFTVSGFLLVDGPAAPMHQPAPLPTDTPLTIFTSTHQLTCTDAGTAQIGHGLQATMGRADLAEAMQDAFPDIDHVRVAGSLSVTVECVPEGTETPFVTASGTYTGEITITGIPGLPGGTYTDPFTLEVRTCGEVTLTQGSDQASHGHLYTVVDFEPEQAGAAFFQAHLFGQGADYAEGYSLDVIVQEGGTIVLSGLTAGGGHGFGSQLTELEVWSALLLTQLETNPLPQIDLGWAGQIEEAILDRIGDATRCE